MNMKVSNVSRTIRSELWWVVYLVVLIMVVDQALSLNGPNVCMVKQKYNITKRIKYRAPMSVRTYEWCMAMPPRCSKWTTEMRDLTRLETEERTAEVAICCPGFKINDVTCVPICPYGKTGAGCLMGCQRDKWGPNCVNDCKKCPGACSPITGECICQDGWQGERCEKRMSTITTPSTTRNENLLTTPYNTQLTTIETKPLVPITVMITKSADSKAIKNITTPQSITTLKKSTQTRADDEFKRYENTSPQSIRSVQSTFGETSTKVISSFSTSQMEKTTTEDPHKKTFLNNETEKLNHQDVTKISDVVISISTTTDRPFRQKVPIALIPTVPTTTVKVNNKSDVETTLMTKKQDTTRHITTAISSKPKEIWIRPAQKGELSVAENKTKQLQEVRYKHTTKKEGITTPRTIIVSIIPTSLSYPVYKKIYLTTLSYMETDPKEIITKNAATDSKIRESSQSNHNVHKIKQLDLISTAGSSTTSFITKKPIGHKISASKSTSFTRDATAMPQKISTKSISILNNNTNSMSYTKSEVKEKLFTSPYKATTAPAKIFKNGVAYKQSVLSNTTEVSLLSRKPNLENNWNQIVETTLAYPSLSNKSVDQIKKDSLAFDIKQKGSLENHNVTVAVGLRSSITVETKLTTHRVNIDYANKNSSSNANNSQTNQVTPKTVEDESFHVLTEPEHITAVADDKALERTTIELKSVIIIAGGVMMTLITVAVIIVMIDRCKRTRYEDVGKINDIRMKVVIDNNDKPPPYTRSIFNSPLPDVPVGEKCHYQPISTLDRNLKQFMRPVVIQSSDISPLMLENFRGILECHYDHLPRRSYDSSTLLIRNSVTPSMSSTKEPLCSPSLSVTESTIEALKCEAKFDEIDSTTSEPLYAEIPCWRPPLEHAVEVVNLNGEAVTEL